MNPDFLETRKKQIEQYFMSLTHIPEIVHSSTFKDFIKPFDKAPIVKNKPGQKKMFSKETSEAIGLAIAKFIEAASMEYVSLLPFKVIPEENDREYDEKFRVLVGNVQKYEENYKALVVNLKIPLNFGPPKAIPENVFKLKKVVTTHKMIDKSFDECVKIINQEHALRSSIIEKY